MNKNRLTMVPGESQRDEWREVIRSLRAAESERVEFYELTAKMTRTKYDALVAEGFTEAQALELCKVL